MVAPLGLLAFLSHRAVAEKPLPLPLLDHVFHLWQGYNTCGVLLFFLMLAFALLPQDRINVTVLPLDVAPAIGTFPSPDSPFYPSDAETTSGHVIPATELMMDKYCGRCHQDIYNQWYASAHYYSSLNNPWHRRTIQYIGERKGLKPATWCGGCHNPVLLFSGKTSKALANSDIPEANAGITCISCHSIVRMKNLRGNAHYVIEFPLQYPFASSNFWPWRYLSDLLIRAKPEPHNATFQKSFHETPEFCALCHRNSLELPLNDYTWLRAQDEYGAWQHSGISGNSAMSFYSLDKPKICNDCHMPLVESFNDDAAKDGKVRSHLFLAANTGLPGSAGG